MMNNDVPRIRGKVGRIEDERPEFAGKWAFTIWLSRVGDGTDGEEFGTWGPYDTEVDAQFSLRAKVDEMVKAFQVEMGEEPTGECFNLLNNRYERGIQAHN